MHNLAIYTDERTFWHATGMQALFLPVGGWVGRVRQGGVISAVAVGHRQAALAVMCRG
jgi:hypothetical protein